MDKITPFSFEVNIDGIVFNVKVLCNSDYYYFEVWKNDNITLYNNSFDIVYDGPCKISIKKSVFIGHLYKYHTGQLDKNIKINFEYGEDRFKISMSVNNPLTDTLIDKYIWVIGKPSVWSPHKEILEKRFNYAIDLMYNRFIEQEKKIAKLENKNKKYKDKIAKLEISFDMLETKIDKLSP